MFLALYKCIYQIYILSSTSSVPKSVTNTTCIISYSMLYLCIPSWYLSHAFSCFHKRKTGLDAIITVDCACFSSSKEKKQTLEKDPPHFISNYICSYFCTYPTCNFDLILFLTTITTYSQIVKRCTEDPSLDLQTETLFAGLLSCGRIYCTYIHSKEICYEKNNECWYHW